MFDSSTRDVSTLLTLRTLDIFILLKKINCDKKKYNSHVSKRNPVKNTCLYYILASSKGGKRNRSIQRTVITMIKKEEISSSFRHDLYCSYRVCTCE